MPANTKGTGDKEDTGNKLSETIENLKQHEKVGELLEYASSHTVDTIAYVLIILGIVWSFFNPFYAGLMIGAIFGFYYSSELTAYVNGINAFVESQGVAKSLILGGTLLALFFALPGVFIGAALVIALMQIVGGNAK